MRKLKEAERREMECEEVEAAVARICEEEEVCWREQERQEEEERAKQEKQGAEEHHHAQVRIEASRRWVVVEVPTIVVVEFWELSQTLGVDQEVESGPDKGKGWGLES